MRKLVVFDANDTTKDVISYAQSKGVTVVAIDSKAENIGHALADENALISTYDNKALLKYFTENQIDGAVYFTSAHGLYAISQVTHLLKHSNMEKDVLETLSDKAKFRAFLKNNNICHPWFYVIHSTDELKQCNFQYPLIVKPVDGGGNAGISKVCCLEELELAVKTALVASLKKEVILEQFIVSDLQVNGDCIICNGKVQMAFLGKYYYENESCILPYATCFGGTDIPVEIQEKIIEQINQMVSALEIKDAIWNIEFRVDPNGQPYCIEINPRHSGNRIYELMSIEMGRKTAEIAVDIALGDSFQIEECLFPQNCYAYGIAYSDCDGKFLNIEVSEEISQYLLGKYVFRNKGDAVKKFNELRDRVALMLFKFPNEQTMKQIIKNLKSFYKIEVCQ